MKIEPGKLYRTRGGQKARIYAVDGEQPWPIHGAVLENREWKQYGWWPDGRFDRNTDNHRHLDLIEEWTEPKKTKELWLWVFESPKFGYHTSNEWMSEEQMKQWPNSIGGKLSGYKLIGKDPNCVKPLVLEE